MNYLLVSVDHTIIECFQEAFSNETVDKSFSTSGRTEHFSYFWPSTIKLVTKSINCNYSSITIALILNKAYIGIELGSFHFIISLSATNIFTQLSVVYSLSLVVF